MKNYFLIFFTTYLIVLLTKFIFVLYLGNQFSEFNFSQLTYAIFWGYKYDFAASAFIALLVSFFDLNKKLFATLGSIGIISVFLTQIGDILYFADSSRHVGYEVVDILLEANSLFMTALSQHFLITIMAIVVAILLFILFYKLFQTITVSKLNKYYFLKSFFVLLISVFFIRGMFQHIPLHPWQANEIGNTQLASVSLNSIYNIVYTLANKGKKLEPIKLPKIGQNDIQLAMQTIYKPVEPIATPILNNKPNIVMLFMESWSAKFMSAYGYQYPTTPYFDKLLEKSIRPRGMVAGGHRTTEGIFTALTSFQNPLGQTIAKTQLQNYKYDSIIYLLNKAGYQSAFFQGTAKDTSGTGSLVNYLGFKQSFGKRDIKERIYDENYWGVQDTDLYNFISRKLDSKEIKEPFVIGLNNASTHDSVTPPNFKRSHFSNNADINEKLNTLNYSDQELAVFINNIEEKYPNTVFIILADHCGGSLTDNLDNYLIPFAIYSKDLKAKYYDVVLSQRDIAPTIYDLVFENNSEEKKNFTGKSLFNENNEFNTDYFHSGVLGWIEENNVVEISINSTKSKCFTLNGLSKEKTSCNDLHKDMKKRALSFTTVSQKLLFEGKTQEFYKYKE